MFATEGAGSTQSEAEGVGGVLRVGRFTCTKHLQDSFAVGSWLSIRLHFFFHEESALWTLTDFQWLLMVDCSLEISWEGAPGAQHCWALPGAAQSPEPCERPGEGQGASGPGQLTAMCIWGRSKQMIWVGGQLPAESCCTHGGILQRALGATTFWLQNTAQYMLRIMLLILASASFSIL